MAKMTYEAPQGRDLSGMGASGQDPLACLTGFTPSGPPDCTVGFSAGGLCLAGATAGVDCAVGQGAMGGLPCTSGGAPSTLCQVGSGLGEPVCSVGSAVGAP
jgi:hypothetical protein